MFHRALLLLLLLSALILSRVMAPAAIGATDDRSGGIDLRDAVGSPSACADRTTTPRLIPPQDSVTLPILMYHHIKQLPPKASATWRNLTVSPQAFEAQLRYLAEQGYHTIYFSELIAYFNAGASLPEKPIILTFDDGWIDHYTVVYPLLQKYCMVGTFFPPVNWVENGNGKQVISWEMIEEMSRGGMEFGSHTLNHHLLTGQTEKQIMAQLVDSKAALEQHTGKPVVVFAYPGGGHNALAVSLTAKAGYEAAVGIMAGVEQTRDDLFLLHRITVPYSDDLKTFAARIRSKRPPPFLPGSSLWPDPRSELADR